MLGGATLWQLRQALAAAESEVEGGLSPRVSPFADLRDAAGLLQRAGFALPVADSETIEVEYESALALMRDLGAMGESNLVVERRRGLARRATLLRAAEIYGERFALPSGRVAASFEVLFLHGWAPHDSQPKPLKPGSAGPTAGRRPGHRRAERRREGGAELDRACREIVVRRRADGELRLLLRPPPPVLPPRHHPVDPLDRHPHRRLDARPGVPGRGAGGKGGRRDPDRDVHGGLAAGRSARPAARRPPAGSRLVIARNGLSRPPDQGRRHHLRAGVGPHVHRGLARSRHDRRRRTRSIPSWRGCRRWQRR